MSGGYNKFRCKYWLSHDCPNWVYMNGHACGACLAEGREAGEGLPAETEVQIPQGINGTLEYMTMGLVPNERSGPDPGAYYTYLQKVTAPGVPANNIVTSDTPRPIMTTTGIHAQVTSDTVWPVVAPTGIPFKMQTRW
ncbi:hypothetical protein QBC38DRAFT_54387 [Podospora fimiseda]|uniref:Uncharacterized protein n=1 Tax=Podospora fimiseda TaxID=252190 RepID=A0AAN7GU84_9PEZI|nr:hypothetical protein QBC38DRAFT_54387 [Podospora fimiseda]